MGRFAAFIEPLQALQGLECMRQCVYLFNESMTERNRCCLGLLGIKRELRGGAEGCQLLEIGSLKSDGDYKALSIA